MLRLRRARRPRAILLSTTAAVALFFWCSSSSPTTSTSSKWTPFSSCLFARHCPPTNTTPAPQIQIPTIPSPLPYPSDYARSEDQELCHKMFGPGYFSHIATHHHAYCETDPDKPDASEESAVRCFFAPRLPEPWGSEYDPNVGDPMCIVRGVRYDPTITGYEGESRKGRYRVGCVARDFDAERRARFGGVAFEEGSYPLAPAEQKELRAVEKMKARGREAARKTRTGGGGDDGGVETEEDEEDISYVPNLDDLHVYWGGTGPGGAFGTHWEFTSTSAANSARGKGKDGHGHGHEPEACSPTNNNGRWLLLVKREDNPNIYHAHMNLWQALLSVDALRSARDPATGLPWLSDEDFSEMQVVFDDNNPETPMDEWWGMTNGRKPIRYSELDPQECYGNVLLPLAGSASPFWAAYSENIYHEPCREGFLVEALRRRVLKHLKINERGFRGQPPPEEPAITVVNRTTTRKIWGLNGMVQTLRRRYPESEIRVVDLAAMDLRAQVELMAETDVLVAHHGAGMTHLFWMPPDSSVVEISTARRHQFRSLTRLRGLAHFQAVALEREEYDFLTEGKEVLEGWVKGEREGEWQFQEWSYLVEDEFLAWVDAAVRNQRNRRYF